MWETVKKLALPLFLVYGGCLTNAWTFEVLVRIDSSCGELLSSTQFLLTASFAFLFRMLDRDSEGRLRLKKRNYHLGYHGALVLLYFASSVLNNKAINFNISVPLHIVIRSGNILTNAIIGCLFLKKSITKAQLVSVLVLTCGICLFTLASTPGASFSSASLSNRSSSCLDSSSCCGDENGLEIGQVVVDQLDSSPDLKEFDQINLEKERKIMNYGVGLLVIALFLNALMGPIQDQMYRSQPDIKDGGAESLFYTHALALPMFLFLTEPILNSFNILKTQTEIISCFGIPIPLGIIFLAINIVTHLMCISGVYMLISQTSSLTTAVLLVIRKFASIAFNVIFFRSDFGLLHALGAFFVASGVITYLRLASRKKEFETVEEEKEKGPRKEMKGVALGDNQEGNLKSQQTRKTKED